MYKARKLILAVLAIGIAITLSGCKKETGTQSTTVQDTNKEAIVSQEKSSVKLEETKDLSLAGWKTYTNPKYNYEVKYPSDWFYMEDACCPPPPGGVNLNNFSAKKDGYAANQTKSEVYGIDFLCLYEGRIDDIGEVQLQRSEGIENELTKINGLDAIKFTKNVVPGDPSKKVLTYYIVDGMQGCRSTFTDDCDECSEIISSFKYL